MTLDFWCFILTHYFETLFWGFIFILRGGGAERFIEDSRKAIFRMLGFWHLIFDALFWFFILALYFDAKFDALFWRFDLTLYFDALFWCFNKAALYSVSNGRTNGQTTLTLELLRDWKSEGNIPSCQDSPVLCRSNHSSKGLIKVNGCIHRSCLNKRCFK